MLVVKKNPYYALDARSRYTMYHPYLNGHKGAPSTESSSDTLRCGKRREYCEAEQDKWVCEGKNWYRKNTANKYIPVTEVKEGVRKIHLLRAHSDYVTQPCDIGLMTI